MSKKEISSLLVLLFIVAFISVFYISYKKDRKESGQDPLANPAGQNTNNDIASAGACTAENSVTVVSKDSKGSSYLSNCLGLALYVSDKDEEGKSNCIGDCLKTWTPYLIPTDRVALSKTDDELGKKFNVIKRADGTSQYSIGTKPLYTYSGDKAPGDLNGTTIATWHVATP